MAMVPRALALTVAGCLSTGAAPNQEESPMSSSSAVELTCSQAVGAPAVRCEARNVSQQTVHVFESKRMPYLLLEGDGLVLLFGVHEAPPLKSFNMVEIPVTRPLAPGETLRFERVVDPLVLANHYETVATPAHFAGEHRLVGRVGWLSEPVTREMVHQIAMPWLLARQQTADAVPITVNTSR